MIQNLLSQPEKQALKSGYKMRFLVTLSWTLFFAFLVSTVIFVPVYFIVNARTENVMDKIQMNASALKEQEDVLSLPGEINGKTKLILSFKSKPQISGKIAVLGRAASGITLSGISSKGSDKVFVSGISINRESLLAFEKKLREVEFVADTEVPVSSFAKDTDLPFTVTITLKP